MSIRSINKVYEIDEIKKTMLSIRLTNEVAKVN